MLFFFKKNNLCGEINHEKYISLPYQVSLRVNFVRICTIVSILQFCYMLSLIVFFLSSITMKQFSHSVFNYTNWVSKVFQLLPSSHYVV